MAHVKMNDAVVRNGVSYMPGREYDLPDDVAKRLAARGTVDILDEEEAPKRKRKSAGAAPENKSASSDDAPEVSHTGAES